MSRTLIVKVTGNDESISPSNTSLFTIEEPFEAIGAVGVCSDRVTGSWRKKTLDDIHICGNWTIVPLFDETSRISLTDFIHVPSGIIEILSKKLIFMVSIFILYVSIPRPSFFTSQQNTNQHFHLVLTIFISVATTIFISDAIITNLTNTNTTIVSIIIITIFL